ncbi:MAG: glycosyltransferase family 4 protein [Candidatus Bathyarchaeia archaeon]
MKILMICEELTKSSIVAQPWKHIFELARKINQMGHVAEILTNFSHNSSSSYEEINGIPVWKVNKGKFLFNSQELLKALNSSNADIVNWHGSDLWSSIHFWRLRKTLRKNVVWTLHSYPFSVMDLRNLDFKHLPLLYRFWNNILNASFPSLVKKSWINIPQLKFIITASERLKKYLENMKVENKGIKVIRSGVDTEKFKPQSANIDQDIFLPKDKVILYFGPFSYFRGIDTLVSTMPIILRKEPSAKFLVLAREVHKHEYQILQKLRNKKEVHVVTGVIETELLIRYLSLSSVVVFPFRFWPQVECPLTILEAMSMEKPIVATKIGAIPEIINHGKNGILVPPGNSQILAKKIIHLLENETLSSEIGKNARKTVVNLYDWDIVAQQTLELFQRVFELKY